MGKFRTCKNDIPVEHQMLMILRSYTDMQNKLHDAHERISELSETEAGWTIGQLKTRLEKAQLKYDNLKAQYRRLLKANNRRKEIMKSVWDLIPEGIKQKFEQDDTKKFEDSLDKIDNQKVV